MASPQFKMLRVFLLVVVISCVRGFVPKQVPDGRIVGGSPTTIDKFPFMASLYRPLLGHFCGASIITQTSAVTAAHCVQGLNLLIYIRVGSTSRSSGGQTKLVTNIRRHPSYDAAAFDYDVAIVSVGSSFNLNGNVQPINIPPADFPLPPGTKVNATGWGTLTESGSSPTNLQTVELEIVSDEDCKTAYGEEDITDRMVCAASSGKDSCQGDSGGPLSIGNILIGIVSWGNGCAREGFPGVYANAINLRDWILSNA